MFIFYFFTFPQDSAFLVSIPKLGISNLKINQQKSADKIKKRMRNCLGFLEQIDLIRAWGLYLTKLSDIVFINL